MSGTTSLSQDGLSPGGACEDCGLSLSLCWNTLEKVRSFSLNFMQEWDTRELKGRDLPATGSLHLTPTGWAYYQSKTEQTEAAEKMRIQALEVNRRTMCYRELIAALLGHARAWLCHGGIDSNGIRREPEECVALEPTSLEREWNRVFCCWTGQSLYQSVTIRQMKDVFYNVDSVVLEDGAWTQSLLVHMCKESRSDWELWRSNMEFAREISSSPGEQEPEDDDEDGMV